MTNLQPICLLATLLLTLLFTAVSTERHTNLLDRMKRQEPPIIVTSPETCPPGFTLEGGRCVNNLRRHWTPATCPDGQTMVLGYCICWSCMWESSWIENWFKLANKNGHPENQWSPKLSKFSFWKFYVVIFGWFYPILLKNVHFGSLFVFWRILEFSTLQGSHKFQNISA